MKNNGDLAQKWLKMADEEFAVAQRLTDEAVGLAAACFHSQQAAEKALKAWLIAHDLRPDKTHKLEKLLTQCAQVESSFRELFPDAKPLTKHAVEDRYDADFWPSMDQARTALERARRIYNFVKAHWKEQKT
jgi:HEPN domain-containing protein